MRIEKVSVNTIFSSSTFDELAHQYAQETRHQIFGDGEPQVAKDLYRDIEKKDMLSAFAVYDDNNDLRGFGVVVMNVSLHTSKIMAIVEAIYVDPEARAGAAGLRLLAAMRHQASEWGARVMIVNCRVGSKLDAVMTRLHEGGRVDRAYNSYFVPVKEDV